ncbi:MAG: hypothetical protein KKA60_14435 [Proteobacteria bacterium]|nr:hypothetical protein [Pseudomonadota bacterium]
MTTIGDLVLVHFKNEPGFFARVEDINSDPKPGWYRVRLLVLAVPLQDITWILRPEYLDGAVFTMEGQELHIQKVEPLKQVYPSREDKAEEDGRGAKVVSLLDRKK